MKWTEVQVRTKTENEEIVTNALYDLGVQGLAIEDPKDILDLVEVREDWDLIDEKLINQGFNTIIIKCYLGESEDLIKKIQAIKKSIKGLGQVVVSEIYEQDWSEKWKTYYKPIKIGKNIVIKPSWEDYKSRVEDVVIELDPGMAFGTGTHETTILCIEDIEKYMKTGDKVFDIGCGSGILSIVAAKLGAKKVISVDLDDLAVKVAKENIEKNNVDNIVNIEKGNLLDVVEEKADLIVSNILAEVIVKLSNSIKNYLNDEGLFISSGIIKEKKNIVEEALKENNFTILETKTMDGWVSIVAKYKKDGHYE
ncbi:MAG TPA: 50S ribosomal protein L11 methyltransferase [Tissierellales bacterium]|nr:50S ribosomal protein L11 methyltransferase [Tissierellales bacterium]